MDNPKCDACGAPMKRNGKTKLGAQRWRCKGCGASSTHHIDNSAKQLKAFLKWLMGKQTIEEAASCSKATFERRTERFWRLWPLSSYTGEVHDVVFVDGIYVTRKLVVLIASTRRQNVLAWHLAESECSEAWAALLLQVPPPTMAVTDGGSGFAKAARAIWPDTKIQRCLVHIKRQVVRKTTMNPRLEAGKQLLALGKEAAEGGQRRRGRRHGSPTTQSGARGGEVPSRVHAEGRKEALHAREAQSARHSLNALVEKKGTMFDVRAAPGTSSAAGGSPTNNSIEGGVNSQIRSHAPAPQGPSGHEKGEGCVLVVLPAFGLQGIGGGDAEDHEDGRRSCRGCPARASGTSGQKTDGPSEFDSHLSRLGRDAYERISRNGVVRAAD